MEFRKTLNNAGIAELAPQPWDYTAPDGVNLTVIPAGPLAGDDSCAEVNVRITRPDAGALAEYGITGPDSRGVAQVGVPAAVLPALINSLAERTGWEDTRLPAGTLSVFPGVPGVVVSVTEVRSKEVTVTETVQLPDAQRLPLASALRRALRVAHGWKS